MQLHFKTSALLFLALLLNTEAKASDSKMQMFIAPPQRYVKWDSPAKLSYTFLLGWLKSHQFNPLRRVKTAMGHGMVHVTCTDSKNAEHEFWTGITGSGDTETDLVLKEKVGIGIIFMNFDNGYIQKEEEVKRTLSAYRGRLEKNQENETKRLKPLFIEFDLSAKECDDAVAFYSAFKNRSFEEPKPLETRKAMGENEKLYFGLTLEPYELYKSNGPSGYLGGGCTSYASAFLKAAGKYDEKFDQFFKREIVASEKQMGGAGNRIGLAKLLLGKRGRSWVQKFTDNLTLKFYDPEMMFSFLDSVRSCAGDTTSISECRPDVKDWSKNYDAELTEITVSAPYKGIDYTNTIQGVHLKRREAPRL